MAIVKAAPRRRRVGSRRYVAKLFFQHRFVVGGKSDVRRYCEEQMRVFHAPNARAALAYAKKRGRAAAWHSRNAYGIPWHFEFIGVMDLLELGVECEEDEVWYDVMQRIEPMERKKKWVPPERQLTAIRNEMRRRSRRGR